MKIYLSVPYTGMEDESFEKVSSKAAELMRQRHIVFSPINHTHHMGKLFNLPGDWQFWKEQDEAFIPWCDELWVLCLDGWEKSVGVRAEMDLAISLGKEIRFIGE